MKPENNTRHLNLSCPVRGVLNINKPSGVSSYDVIRRIKQLLSTQSGIHHLQSRIPLGHAGTLDPLASGVLLVLLGEATKVSRFLLGLTKEYVASVLFGKQTDTDDITGKVLNELPVAGLTAQRVQSCLEAFIGEIEQVPPAFSALKQDGQPQYRLARKGLPVRTKTRSVTVYQAELLEWAPPTATIRCRVSAGTYVRALARDLGEALGTGATLASLVRTKLGQFTVEDATALDAFDATPISERLIPICEALTAMPRVTVSPVQAQHLHQGKVVSGLEGAAATAADGLVLAQTEDHRFLAVVVSKGARLHTERIIYAD